MQRSKKYRIGFSHTQEIACTLKRLHVWWHEPIHAQNSRLMEWVSTSAQDFSKKIILWFFKFWSKVSSLYLPFKHLTRILYAHICHIPTHPFLNSLIVLPQPYLRSSALSQGIQAWIKGSVGVCAPRVSFYPCQDSNHGPTVCRQLQTLFFIARILWNLLPQFESVYKKFVFVGYFQFFRVL